MCVQRRKIYYLIDLLEDHPFEIGTSIALVLFGVRSFITGLQSVPNSVSSLPFLLIFVYCTLSVLGGSAVLFGLGARYKYMWAYGVERAGLFVSASAWGVYTIGFLFSPFTINSTLFILALLALSGGCLLRARAIRRRSSATIIALRHAKAHQEGQ